jgi:hypothetical protein
MVGDHMGILGAVVFFSAPNLGMFGKAALYCHVLWEEGTLPSQKDKHTQFGSKVRLNLP